MSSGRFSRRLLGFPGPQTPLLGYHAVSEEADPRVAPMSVTPAQLERHLSLLQQAGRTFLTVSRYVDALRDGILPERAVVLTFDDAFLDFRDHALPLLSRHEATATLYVPTAHIGGTSSWASTRGGGDLPLLDWSDLGEVRAAGIEIGGHGHTHRPLDSLPAGVVTDEVRRCKRLLEDHLGEPVRSFAYPYGHHDATARRAVREAGFDSACEIRRLPSAEADDPFALRRLLVTGTLTDQAFVTLVEDVPGRRARAVMEAKAVTARVLRRAKRRQSS